MNQKQRGGGKKTGGRRECVCVCFCTHTHTAFFFLHVVATETIPARVCVRAFLSAPTQTPLPPLCRPAKPPVPRLHLWSPGEWLIWKSNHSGHDFISSLSRSPRRSYLSHRRQISTSRCLVLHRKTSDYSPSSLSLSLSFNAAFPALPGATLFPPATGLHPLGGAEPCWAPNLTYWEEDEVWVITNQPRVGSGEGEREGKHSVSWKVLERSLWIYDLFFKAWIHSCAYETFINSP